MSQNNIIEALGTISNLFAGSGTQSKSNSAQEGFNFLQPIMQNFLSQNTNDDKKVEDLDDDGIMDVIAGVAKNVDIPALLKNIRPEQVAGVMSFIQEKMKGTSGKNKDVHEEGIAAIFDAVRGQAKDTTQATNDADGNDISDLIGGVLSSFIK